MGCVSFKSNEEELFACCIPVLVKSYEQLRTMDHLARRSMKNAANCVKYGELQGSRNRNVSNAYGAFNIPMLEARLSEGLLVSLMIFMGIHED
jgi:hypothetical protein